MSYRIDYGTLGEATPTPQGGLAVPADITRAGVFVYRNPDGTERREWRPLAEVSRPETIASLKGATLTVRHPGPGRLAPDNHAKYGRGHVGDDVRMDAGKTAATIYVQGKEALDAIKGGWRQVSAGYDQNIRAESGVVPAGEPDAGQRYDAIQTNIIYNHVALVPNGRAGAGVRLRLDSDGNSDTGEEMKIEIIGGTEYEVGTAAHTAARTRQDATDAAHATEVAKLRTDAAEAAGKVAALTAQLATLSAAEKVRQDAADRVAIIAKAQPVLGKDWKDAGLSNEQCIAAAVAKQYPSVRLDAVDEAIRPAYVKGLWDSLPEPKVTKLRTDERERHLAPIEHAGGKGKSLRERRTDSLDVGCGPSFTLMRGKANGNRRQPEQASMIENQR